MARAPGPSARALGLAIVAAFLLRAAFGVLYWTGKPLTHDEREYLALAANVWQGRGFTHALPFEPPTTVQQFGRAPLYPLFLAPLTALDADLAAGRMPADVPTAIKLAQALAGAVSVWILACLAARAAGRFAGLVAAWIAAVYPPFVWICAYALSEAVFVPLALGCVWFVGAITDRGSGRPSAALKPTSAALVGTGALAGLAALTRPAMLFFIPLGAVLLWHRAENRRAGIVRAAIFAGIAALMIAPWTLRNVRTHGRFVLIASEGGVTFWTGNHPEATGEGDLAANPRLKELNLVLREMHRELSEEEMESVYYREALRGIVADPGQWAVLLAKKLWFTFVPTGPSYQLHSMRYRLASSLSYLALVPFAIAGAWRLRRTPPWALWAFAAAGVLVALVFFPQERFRIASLDPVLVMFAAAVARRRTNDEPQARD